MVVKIDPLTEKDSHIIKGLIINLHKTVSENPSEYNKPNKILEHQLVNLIYEHGINIVKVINECVDDCPIVCIVLMGGMIKLGLIRNFFLDENRGNLFKMSQEVKDFCFEFEVKNIIKKVESETREFSFLQSRIKSKEVQNILTQDLRLLVRPLYEMIDTHTYTCLAMIHDLIVKEKLKSIFDADDFGNKTKMAEKYKDFYLYNRVKFLVEKIASNPDGLANSSAIRKREAIDEILKLGEASLKPIYKIIDEYKATCTQLVPLILKRIPYEFKNFGLEPNGKAKLNTLGMVDDFKKWYESEYISSKQTV